MLKLVIGNKAYSSWSLRGWLAVKQSGLPFEEIVHSMFGPDWDERQATDPLLAPSRGKVPILWEGDSAVWESTAIIDWLADRVGREAYWPFDDTARAFARSIAAEMHAGFQALRSECGMNVRRHFPDFAVSDAVHSDIARIDALWSEARTRFGQHGPYLFGAFGGADIMFAPVVTRFVTYGLPLSATARAYVDTMMANPFMVEWLEGANAEEWVIDKYEL